MLIIHHLASAKTIGGKEDGKPASVSAKPQLFSRTLFLESEPIMSAWQVF